MKSLVCFFVFLLALNASASSWEGVRCSNSDGTVNWKTGYEEDQINLTYSNFIRGVLTLDMDKVSIQFTKDLILLKQQSFRSLTSQMYRRVFAAHVIITASAKHPDVLVGQFPDNKIETEVICTSETENSIK